MIKSATFYENFLFLIDCLMTPKCEMTELGDFDVGTFLLLVLVSLESRGQIGADTSSCNVFENQGH